MIFGGIHCDGEDRQRGLGIGGMKRAASVHIPRLRSSAAQPSKQAKPFSLWSRRVNHRRGKSNQRYRSAKCSRHKHLWFRRGSFKEDAELACISSGITSPRRAGVKHHKLLHDAEDCSGPLLNVTFP